VALRSQYAPICDLKLALYEHHLRWVRQVHSNDEGPAFMSLRDQNGQ
jgi:hypothetical protein